MLIRVVIQVETSEHGGKREVCNLLEITYEENVLHCLTISGVLLRLLLTVAVVYPHPP